MSETSTRLPLKKHNNTMADMGELAPCSLCTCSCLTGAPAKLTTHGAEAECGSRRRALWPWKGIKQSGYGVLKLDMLTHMLIFDDDDEDLFWPLMMTKTMMMVMLVSG